MSNNMSTMRENNTTGESSPSTRRISSTSEHHEAEYAHSSTAATSPMRENSPVDDDGSFTNEISPTRDNHSADTTDADSPPPEDYFMEDTGSPTTEISSMPGNSTDATSSTRVNRPLPPSYNDRTPAAIANARARSKRVHAEIVAKMNKGDPEATKLYEDYLLRKGISKQMKKVAIRQWREDETGFLLASLAAEGNNLKGNQIDQDWTRVQARFTSSMANVGLRGRTIEELMAKAKDMKLSHLKKDEAIPEALRYVVVMWPPFGWRGGPAQEKRSRKKRTRTVGEEETGDDGAEMNDGGESTVEPTITTTANTTNTTTATTNTITAAAEPTITAATQPTISSEEAENVGMGRYRRAAGFDRSAVTNINNYFPVPADGRFWVEKADRSLHHKRGL